MPINMPSRHDSKHTSLAQTHPYSAQCSHTPVIPRPVPDSKRGCRLSNTLSVHLSLPGLPVEQGLHFGDYSISSIAAR